MGEINRLKDRIKRINGQNNIIAMIFDEKAAVKLNYYIRGKTITRSGILFFPTIESAVCKVEELAEEHRIFKDNCDIYVFTGADELE